MAMAEFSELGDTNLRAEGLVDFSVREVPDLVKSGEMLVFRVPLSCPSKGCPIQTQCPFPLPYRRKQEIKTRDFHQKLDEKTIVS
jgi:hypothetical protein